jgi:hypothetical protein
MKEHHKHHHKEHMHHHKKHDPSGDMMSPASKGDHTVHGSHLNNWKHEKPIHTTMGQNPKWGGPK